jgi:hypothetical protein
MTKLSVILLAVLLSGCAGLTGLIPSFWDDNQSSRIVSVRLDIERLNCKAAQLPQVERIRDDLEWFRLYSDSKGHRQRDVLALTKPMKETVEDWYKRVAAEGHRDNPIYCDLKKRVLQEQSARAAKAVLGRF